jgi:hypothetical protein
VIVDAQKLGRKKALSNGLVPGTRINSRLKPADERTQIKISALGEPL